MSVPKSLAPCETPEQGNRRIGEIVERQQQGCGKMLMRCQFEQTPAGEEAYRQAADVTQKQSGHGPVERCKAEQCAGKRQRDRQNL